MPALSQSLTFTVNSTSTVVLDYPNTATTALVYSSDPVKGRGYFGNTDGIHTLQISLHNFVGTLQVEGTLASVPTTPDWFVTKLVSNTSLTMDTTGAISEAYATSIHYTQPTTNVKTYNFSGNYTWVRVKVSDWTEGTVNSIQINH